MSGDWVRKATPTETVPTVYNGLWLTAALEEREEPMGTTLRWIR